MSTPPDGVSPGAEATDPPAWYNRGVGSKTQLHRRVIDVAEAVLAERKHVAPVDIVLGLRWLHQSHVEAWRRGRLDYLERVLQVDAVKRTQAMEIFRTWAEESGLEPSETAYVARARDRHHLRFTEDGDPSIERIYHTHWVSPDLPENKKHQLTEQTSRPPDLVVISPLQDWTCEECGGTGDLLIMEGPGPLCLDCADMGHLVFLPAGNSALTRRSKKASRLSAVVVRFSRARRRYERQGILVEEAALEQAESECLADEDLRARRRERDALRREAEDREFVSRLAAEIRRIFPGCDPSRVEEIARHTAVRGSSRVGRSAAARELDPRALELAVTASVRHRDSRYDELLMAGVERWDARERVASQVRTIMDRWRRPAG